MNDRDINMIQYYWSNKGRVDGWHGWEEVKEKAKTSHPELVAAYDNYNLALRTLDAIVRSLEPDEEPKRDDTWDIWTNRKEPEDKEEEPGLRWPRKEDKK